MGLADIETVINSIPAKKKDLQKAFEELQSYSSSFTPFTFQWKDIEEHISSIEKSIGQRFQELKALDTLLGPENPAAPLPAVIAKEDQYKLDVDLCSKLKSHCINMDAKELRSCVFKIQKDCVAIRRELGTVLLFAPDPVALVLDSFEGFAPIEQMAGEETQKIRNACFTLLGSLHQMALDIKPFEKERARRLAVECKGLIVNGKMKNTIIVLLFLQLIVTFGLIEFFEFDFVLDLLAMVAKKKPTLDLCMSSILKEKVPDLIEKLNSTGRQIDSIKFVIAFNLMDKYPPGHLLNVYIKRSKWAPNRSRLKEHNPPKFKHEAISREISSLKTAIKAVEEYHLQHLYPSNNLRRRVMELEKKRRGIRRGFQWNDANSNSPGKMRRQRERTRKKWQPSSNSAETAAVAQAESRNPPQLGFVDDRAAFVGGSGDSHVGGSLYNNLSGLSGPVAPPRRYTHPSMSMAGPAYYNGAPEYGDPGIPKGYDNHS